MRNSTNLYTFPFMHGLCKNRNTCYTSMMVITKLQALWLAGLMVLLHRPTCSVWAHVGHWHYIVLARCLKLYLHDATGCVNYLHNETGPKLIQGWFLLRFYIWLCSQLFLCLHDAIGCTSSCPARCIVWNPFNVTAVNCDYQSNTS